LRSAFARSVTTARARAIPDVIARARAVVTERAKAPRKARRAG